MSKFRTLIQNASDDELKVIGDVLARADAKPAVVVTLQEGSKQRRYVVYQEDEYLFEGIHTPEAFQASHGRFAYFGGQWLRQYGKVDEMSRTLSSSELVKIQRVPRNKVWGRA